MNMYFKDRNQAGIALAELLYPQYSNPDSVILALNRGALLVAEALVSKLKIPAYLVASKEIDLPGNFHERAGSVDQVGNFSYSSDLTQGQIDEYVAEYHSVFDVEKINAIHDINSLLGNQGFIDESVLTKKNILIVSDGIKKGSELDPVMTFLKPVEALRVIGLAPVASVDAVDRLHILTDEIHVLSTKSNYMETNHYYEVNEIPSIEQVQKIINTISNITP